MIKSENGCVQIKGSTPEVLADLGVIVRAMKECGIDRDSIEHAVELAHRSKEEIRKEAEELKKECALHILQKITEGLDETAKASYTGPEKSDQ